MTSGNPPTPTPKSAVQVCPECRGTRVRRSASTLKHFARLILRSPKRYCPDCRKRWLAADR